MDFQKLITKCEELLATENISAWREIFLELDDALDSQEFNSADEETQHKLITLHQELQNKIKQTDNLTEKPNQSLNADKIKNGLPGTPKNNFGSEEKTTNNSREHDPKARELMEQAEELFYAGKFAEAITFYDRVLEIEPQWERAVQHRSEAENYMRTGFIPQVALPPSAASAFGKAQSAARVGRFEDALEYLNQAKAALAEVGLTRWQEGLEFEKKLHENIEAEAAYRQGLRFFEAGNIEDAIERIETAYRATGLPKYNDKAKEFHKIKQEIFSLAEKLTSLEITAQELVEIKKQLERLRTQYGENPLFDNLASQLDSSLPSIVQNTMHHARALKAKAEQSNSLEDALNLAHEAKRILDLLGYLGTKDDQFTRQTKDVAGLIDLLEQHESELDRALRAYSAHQSWPTEAYKISRNIRSTYPSDPRISRLSQQLRRYQFLRLLQRIGIGIVLILFSALVIWGALSYYRSYSLSLTPTSTSTPTITATHTGTSTATTTSTSTATFTPTFTPTATPLAGVTLRDIWARNGCYEGFTAVGRIPANSTVAFLPAERRFDTFGRECILVEYQGLPNNIIGWVLLIDLGLGELEPTATLTSTPSP